MGQSRPWQQHRPMVTISLCRGCRNEFLTADLDQEGLCVRCLDRLTEYEDGQAIKVWTPLSDEEKKRRKAKCKQIWTANNRERVAASQQRLRAKWAEERRD